MNSRVPPLRPVNMRLRALALFVAMVALTFITLEYVGRPYDNYVWYRLMDWGHIPLFGVLAVALVIISRKVWMSPHSGLWHYLTAGARCHSDWRPDRIAAVFRPAKCRFRGPAARRNRRRGVPAAV